jgi:hypothetical protein
MTIDPRIYQLISIQVPTKFTQIWIFGWKIYHLATLMEILLSLAKKSVRASVVARGQSRSDDRRSVTVAIFFLLQYSKTGETLSNNHKIFEKALKSSKWPLVCHISVLQTAEDDGE